MFTVQTMHTHAGKCKKTIDDCLLCQANIKVFAEIPLPMLSHALEQILRPTLKASLKDVVTWGALDNQKRFKDVVEVFKRFDIKVK